MKEQEKQKPKSEDTEKKILLNWQSCNNLRSSSKDKGRMSQWKENERKEQECTKIKTKRAKGGGR